MMSGGGSYLLARLCKTSFVLIVGKQTVQTVHTGDSVPGQRGSQIWAITDVWWDYPFQLYCVKFRHYITRRWYKRLTGKPGWFFPHSRACHHCHLVACVASWHFSKGITPAPHKANFFNSKILKIKILLFMQLLHSIEKNWA